MELKFEGYMVLNKTQKYFLAYDIIGKFCRLPFEGSRFEDIKPKLYTSLEGAKKAASKDRRFKPDNTDEYIIIPAACSYMFKEEDFNG